MIYEYNGYRFVGTYSEIVKALTGYLDSCELTYSLSSWHLCHESLEIGCRPDIARKSMTDIVIMRIPRKYIFQGQVFNNADELRSYLSHHEIRHLGGGLFSLYTYSKRFITNMSLNEIRNQLIEEVINDI